MPAPPILALATVAAIEGIGLLAYAAFDVVELVRDGLTGPSEVSNGPAIAVLTAIQVVFGAGMLWVARGWWRERRWARSPFVVAQLLLFLIGIDLVSSTGPGERVVGAALIAVSALAVILSFSPPVARSVGR